MVIQVLIWYLWTRYYSQLNIMGEQLTMRGITGIIVLTTGGGTGQESIAITLPSNTGLEMEVILGCQTATVSILDSNYTEVVSFDNIKVLGNTGLCQVASNDTRSRIVRNPKKKAS